MPAFYIFIICKLFKKLLPVSLLLKNPLYQWDQKSCFWPYSHLLMDFWAILPAVFVIERVQHYQYSVEKVHESLQNHKINIKLWDLKSILGCISVLCVCTHCTYMHINYIIVSSQKCRRQDLSLLPTGSWYRASRFFTVIGILICSLPTQH